MFISGHGSFILRLWEERDGELACWRFSLENPHTLERKGFKSMEELAKFIVNWQKVATYSHTSLPEEK